MSSEQKARELLKHAAGQILVEMDKIDGLDIMNSTLEIKLEGFKALVKGDVAGYQFEEEVRAQSLKDDALEKRRSSSDTVSEDVEADSSDSIDDATEDAPVMSTSAKETIKDKLNQD